MLSKSSVRVVFAGLLLMSFSAPSPNVIASEADGGSSEVSGSAEGTADGGGQVTISVESSVTTAGSGGGDGGGVTSSSSSSTEVTVNPVCYYKAGKTGAEQASQIDKNKAAAAERQKKQGNKPAKNGVKRPSYFLKSGNSYPDYESHRDDTQGRWYSRYCDTSFFDPKNPEEFKNERKAFFDANRDQNIWVPAGQQAPRPYISGTRLAKVAWDAVKIPAPTVETNPKVGSQGATLVGMDTWVWATGNTPTSVTAKATAGSTTATITAGSSGLQLSAPDGKASCTGFGVAWHSGMPEGSSPCTISFNRSSAHLGGSTPLTIKVAYSASYTATDGNSGTLPAITTTSTVNLPVAEVQTLTTNHNNPRQN